MTCPETRKDAIKEVLKLIIKGDKNSINRATKEASRISKECNINLADLISDLVRLYFDRISHEEFFIKWGEEVKYRINIYDLNVEYYFRSGKSYKFPVIKSVSYNFHPVPDDCKSSFTEIYAYLTDGSKEYGRKRISYTLGLCTQNENRVSSAPVPISKEIVDRVAKNNSVFLAVEVLLKDRYGNTIGKDKWISPPVTAKDILFPPQSKFEWQITGEKIENNILTLTILYKPSGRFRNDPRAPATFTATVNGTPSGKSVLINWGGSGTLSIPLPEGNPYVCVYPLENPEARQCFTVTRGYYPNIQPTEKTKVDGSFEAGSALKISRRFKNVGQKEGTAQITLFVNDREVDRQTVTLKPQQWAYVSFTYTPTHGGDHKFCIRKV